tara:strand:- start:1621 stop:2238 length:618 start_codon:yes stop_codon:yes gene_type:complete
MNCLDIFSGTHSVAKQLIKEGHKCITLDLKDSDINVNILEWDYTEYPVGHFDYIHASPPCHLFSIARKCNLGKKLKKHNGKVFTMEMLIKEQIEEGLPLINKTLEILNYFKPKYYTIENPATGDMKKYIHHLPYTDVTYCMYGFEYKKATRIWNNFDFKGRYCDKSHKHINVCRAKAKDGLTALQVRYRIPEELIKDLLCAIYNN